ncbi:2-hydroxyacid dehydrogenase [Tuberibacillus sp. Marseille-P3662]|uniref:2-hydroxyacid dehydrogenase n=1 Tax=Tuberibacillus sp. Marseille-P3662 TaxID=1965358 RepID=UPI00111BFC77|nr:D-glycerate dehydrogenase [Tuberibacillus sp. Marseille-P3662]
MKPKVFISKSIPPKVEEYISEYCDYEKWNNERPITRNELLQAITEVNGLLTSGGKIDDELLCHAPNLKIVSNMSVGYNNFDIPAMQARNIIGTHTPSIADDTIADLVFGLMLAAARRIPELDRHVKQGKWQSSPGDDTPFFGTDIHHKQLGIIGMGRIGETVAKRAKYGFNMDVLYHNRNRKPEMEAELDATYCSLDSLLQQADFIVLLVPLTEHTFEMMGEKQFDLVKSTSIFINASRGKTVNEQALIHALRTNKVKAAALDVYSEEPVSSNNPLLQMTNVVTSPHIGTATYQARFDMAMLAARNLVTGLQGETPPNLIKEFCHSYQQND